MMIIITLKIIIEIVRKNKIKQIKSNQNKRKKEMQQQKSNKNTHPKGKEKKRKQQYTQQQQQQQTKKKPTKKITKQNKTNIARPKWNRGMQKEVLIPKF